MNPNGSEVWRAMTKAAPEYFTIIDRDFRIRSINHQQPGTEDCVGTDVFEWVAPESHELLRAAVRDASSSGLPQHYETMAAGPHGRTSWYSTWVLPLRVPEEPASAIGILSSDISHLRRIEKELELSREVLSSLIHNAPDYILTVDRDHRIRFANRIDYGFQESEVLGAEVESFLPEEERAKVRAAVDCVFETGAHTSYEVRLDLEDGSHWFFTRLGPVIVGDQVELVTLITTEVTEEHASQDRLRESEERFRTLVQHAPEAITIFDCDLQRFVTVNPNALRLFEMSEADLLASTPVDLSPPTQPDGRSSAEAAREYLERALAGEAPVFEWTHRSASGRELSCEVRLVRLPDPTRPLVRGSITDITDRKRAEAERERLAARLQSSQRMEAVGQLTGGIAHDFNNLLTVILGNLELIGEELPVGSGLRPLAEMASDAGERASALTQRLLAFSRKQPLRPVPVDLNELFTGMSALLLRTLGETIDIVPELAGALWTCEVDPSQMENAILNLSINARDAMPRGGRLSVATANVVLDQADDLSATLRSGEYVEFTVRDEGEGMDAAVLEHVFEPFFTTKEVGRGSGLGLSMVYGFARQSGGDVRVHSAVGRGTTVSLLFPRVRGPVRRRTLAERSSDVPRGRGERVLVVEDEDAVRRLATLQLQQLGYETAAAHDAAAALAQLSSSAPFDLLFTDVVLPGGKDGFQLAREAVALHPRMRLVCATGYSSAAVAGPPPDLSMELLEKPYTRATLARAVRRALDRATR